MPVDTAVSPSPSMARPRAARSNRYRRRVRGVAAIGVLTLAASMALPASAQHLPQPEVAEPSQMLANSGFDAGDAFGHPIEWAVSGSGDSDAVVTDVAADKAQGPTALKVTNHEGDEVTAMSRREVATANTTYTLSGKAKVISGTGATVLMRFYDFNKTLLIEYSGTPTATAFSDFTLTGKAPEGTDLVSVVITGTAATAGVTVFDAFSLDNAPLPYDPKLGRQRELFLDDYRIESAHDVQRLVHPGKKLDAPVIKADKPWEISAYTYGSVFKDRHRYRIWYTCYNNVPPNYYLCYAESFDGEHWRKPDLGLTEWNGSTHNNIVRPGGGTVAYNPDAVRDKRYALLTYRGGVVNDTQGYYGMTSPDGLHWTDVADKPLLLDGDVSNLTFDQRSGRYIASVKKRMFTADTGGYDRSAFVATSTDFVHWTRPQLAVMGDLADDGGAFAKGGLEGQIYGMPILPYESIYIGVPWVFSLLNFTAGQFKTAADGPITPQLAASRDLLHWERPVRDALIEPGHAGAWDDGTTYTASNILVDRTTISMYYAGFNTGHGGADPADADRDNQHGQTGLVTWRRDGFLSLTNASQPGLGDAGEVITKPVVFNGKNLHLNSTVRPKGTLTVQVLNADGTPIPGFLSRSLHRDRLDTTVGFDRSKLKELRGKEVKFKFTLVNADLYSYWVA